MEKKQFIYINSGNRLSGTDGNFTYNIPIAMNNGYDHVVLLQANIPVSYYLVEDGHNRFTLTEEGTDVTIEVPAGNYNMISFKNAVAPILNSMSPNGWTYTMTFNDGMSTPFTGKYIFTVSGNTSQPSFTFSDDHESHIHLQMGFHKHTTNSFVSDTLTSTHIVDFVNEQSVFIHSDMVLCDGNDVLQEVYASNTIPLSNLTYQCPYYEQCSKPLRTNHSTTFHFVLTDKNGVELDFNGLNVVMTLLLYKRDKTMDKLLNYFKLKLLQEHTQYQDQIEYSPEMPIDYTEES